MYDRALAASARETFAQEAKHTCDKGNFSSQEPLFYEISGSFGFVFISYSFRNGFAMQ